MKHNLLKSLIISVILLTGVNNAWGKTIYLYTNGIGWPNDNAKIWVHAWGSGQDTDRQMTKVKDQLYKADIPDDDTEVIFTRTQPTSTGVWDKEWNRVGEQTLNDETPCLKLTDCGTGTWGKISYDAHMYLDNSVANWSEATKEFMIGHSSYSDTYTMTQISNTKLYYLAFSDIWHGYWDYGFIGVTSHWGPYNDQDITTRIKSATKRTGTRGDQVLNGTKLFVPENANNDATLNKFDYNSYNDLNHAQTIKAQVKYGDGDKIPTYQQVISPATITATTKYFNSENSANGNGSLTIDRGETDPARLTQTVNAAYTSTVTLSYTDLHEAYEFMDWWDDTNSKTISTSATCTYVATKATTIYARFKAKKDYTRTVYLDARNWNADNPRYAVYAFYGKNEGQNKWIDMTPAYGTNWYYTCEVSAKYSHVIFCRMNPNNNNNTFNDDSRWGQTNDLLVVLDLDENNCFTPSGDPTEQGGKTYDGNWSTPPTFTVTLEATSNGSFQVTCNGGERTGETINNVPVGTQLTITDIIPNAGYDQTMVYSTDGENYTYFSDSTEIDGKRTYTYTVNSDVTIAEDFRTTEDRDIYLKVTAKPYAYWCNKSNDQEDAPGIVYVHRLNQKEKLYNPSTYRKTFDLFAETNSYNIYKVTIPKGNNSFSIYPSKNHPDATRQSKIFRIPIASSTISCYELYNEEVTIENDIPSTNGQWRDEITVTIKKVADHYDSDGYGHITVQYNNTKYTSKSNEDVTFKTPIGSTITIVESQHEHPETYNGDLKYTDGGYAQYLNDPVNHPISAWGDIEITENFVVRKEVVEKKNLQVYLKIPKTLLAQWKENDVEEKGDNVRPGYDGNKFANFIWLGMEVKPGQSITGSTEAERGCPKRDPSDPKTQPEGSFLMYPVNIADDNYEIYYCTITDYDWHTIKFERKHEDSDPGVAQLTCADVQRFPGGKNNCFTITGRKNDGAFIGEWGEAPQCQVQMTFTNIGRYGFKDCFGNVHYRSPNSKETEFSVPWGSKVEVLEGEPGNDTFTGTVGMLSEGNTTIEKRFHDGENKDNFVTITRNTTFDDLFATKEEHVVYLGIPNEGFDDWYINNSDKMFAWIKEPYNELGLVEIQPTFVIDDITYYQYTLPAGIYEFNFQRKTGNNQDAPICQTRSFTFEIPVTEYNCFILDGNKNGNAYNGYWAKLPAQPENVGDYRVLYAEKELIKTMEEGESEEWETAFRTVYEHPSDIIPQNGKEDTVSLHINTSQKRGAKTVHPMVILQQFQEIGNNTYKWVNLQAHTVLPLKAGGNMAMLPGRKKTFGALPFYDDGIEAIKNDTTYSNRLGVGGLYKGSGVWNFTVTQSGSTVTLNVGNTTRYTGEYYIRTEALTNGWDDYTGNLMTYSDYADYNSGFSHYFCKWLLVGNNVKFTVANDYAQSISDPLYGDATDLWGDPIDYQMVEKDQVLNEDANVRFAWYEMNNFVHRAYLGGSTHVHDRFLIVKDEEGEIFSHPQGTALLAGGDGSPRYGLKANEEIFRDDANWIYHADIQIFPGSTATVIAQHYGKEQTFIKERTLVYGENLNTLENKYPIRLLYDFKINRLITGYIPNGNNTTDIEPFTTNLMLIRKHHEPATQLLFNSNAKTTQGAYGVMTFERDFLRDNTKTNKERAAYFISFPFDVKISDVFGFGQFYKHWFIQYYDGEARAKNGLWADTDTYWRHITDPNTVLEAHKGYALLFSLSNIEKSGVLDASKEICLYFPSTNNNIGNITDVNPEQNVEVPAHVCTIERENRKVKDSNWNLIGVPAYADVSDFTNKTFKDPYNNEVYFYWKRDASTDEYTVEETSQSLTFQTMHAYMLQYAGVINWKAHEMSQPSQLIARRNTEQEASHTLRITLNQADKKLDQTYVRLQEEDATADFDMNKDQYKIKKAKANIYSLIQNAVGQIEAGANVLPLQTTIVPLGVIIKTAGEYTFAMPDGTDGIIAELIDYETNTRTNLLLDNYTVTLPAGTNNSRFALSLQPDKTVTSVDNIGNEATGDKVKKYLIDGVLYMQKDGVLYDAQGRKL